MSKDILEIHQIVDLNVLLIRTVQVLKLVLTINAEIHALEAVAKTLNVELFPMQSRVLVQLVLLAIHLYSVLFNNKKNQIHVNHLHVVQMLCVDKEMGLALVPAYKTIKEIHMKAVVQNVYLVPIVQRIEPVFEINAPILVLVFVDKMQNVKLSITYQLVLVCKDLLAIRLLDVHHHRHVSITQFYFLANIG